ncbi:MAG: SWF/SNF helicase family protein [Nitrococcus sp.]|nr:SWF/SNF helicase family protein [Nitrococcus sp.]
MVGTDAAAEGLNLQRLGCLINLDLPWNPSRLEQRKGRIQRIGQRRAAVDVYNMRYRDSVEERVHEMLSDRLAAISQLFGQLPDVLEDAWIQVALGDRKRAQQTIDQVPITHPFELRYRDHLAAIDWESCARVLNQVEVRNYLKKPWRD